MEVPKSRAKEPLQLRHFNTERLQNAFEDIISKYAQNFEQVGDEIDLEKNEIIINNGHLSGMRNEQDTGNKKRAFIGDFVNEIQRERTRHIPKRTMPQREEEWVDIDDMEMEQEPNGARDGFVSEDEDMDEEEFQPPLPRQSNPPRQKSQASRASTRPIHPAASHPAFEGGYNSYGNNNYQNMAANREMIHEFAQNIASQITEFLYFFAGSMQNGSNHPPQSHQMSMPPPARPESQYSRSTSKRRRIQEDFPSDYPESASRSRYSAPINRLAALRSEQSPKTKHGHRGVTPGMPSLWSGGEEDSDSAPRRRSGKQFIPRHSSASAMRTPSIPQKESRLRAELRNASEPNASDDELIEVGANPASSPMKALNSAKSLQQRQTDTQEVKEEPYYQDEDVEQMVQDAPDVHLIPDSEEEVTSPDNDMPLDQDPEDVELLRQAMGNGKRYHPRISFTPQDDRLIIKLRLEGFKYKEIAAQLPHSTNQVMYRWNKFLVKGDMGPGFGRRPKGFFEERGFQKSPPPEVEDYDQEEDEADLDPMIRSQQARFSRNEGDGQEDEENVDTALRSGTRGSTELGADEEQAGTVNEKDIDPELLQAQPTKRPKPSKSQTTGQEKSKSNVDSSLLSSLEATPTSKARNKKQISPPANDAENTPESIIVGRIPTSATKNRSESPMVRATQQKTKLATRAGSKAPSASKRKSVTANSASNEA